MSLFKRIFGEKDLKKEFRAKTFGYIIAAFGLVAALAWNDAIRGLIDYLFPLEKNSLPAKFVYAIIITVIVVVAATFMLRFSDKDNK